MKKDKIIKLQIGDKLYNYQTFKGVFLYTVVGVREYEESNLYEIECQECLDHNKCRLIVSQIDNLPQFQYVSMVNEDEDNEQYYWHINNYFLSKNDCKKDAYGKAVESHKKAIAKLEEELKRRKQNLAEIQSLIEGFVTND